MPSGTGAVASRSRIATPSSSSPWMTPITTIARATGRAPLDRRDRPALARTGRSRGPRRRRSPARRAAGAVVVVVAARSSPARRCSSARRSSSRCSAARRPSWPASPARSRSRRRCRRSSPSPRRRRRRTPPRTASDGHRRSPCGRATGPSPDRNGAAMARWAMRHTASAPRSPVRMRTRSSTAVTQTLPSPILSVRAAPTMASTTRVGDGVVDDDLQLHLRHEVDLVLRAAVGLGVAALAAEAADLGDGEADDAGALEGVLHVVELERLDHSGDELHGRVSVLSSRRGRRSRRARRSRRPWTRPPPRP